MTGLPMKSSRSNANKRNKNDIGSLIVIKSFPPNKTDWKHSSIEQFLNATSAEAQLGILKSILERQKDTIDDGIIQFLAIVYFEAPAKHPVKCFLARHVTKCTAIQKSFSNFLMEHIVSEVKGPQYNYQEYDYYAEKIPKIMMCIENFPCGTLAVERVGVDLLTKHLFFNYFYWCGPDLRKSALSPTRKNEMFNLEHIMVRLIVHLMQRLYVNQPDWGQSVSNQWYADIMSCVEILISDEEVPMDTKSLSGILLLATEKLRINSEDTWKNLLLTCIQYSNSTEASDKGVYYQALRHKIGRLAVYTAIATTVSIDQLQEHIVDTPSPAVLMLVDQLLSYVDGRASEPAVTVAVARALLQLSRSLGGARADELGGRAVAALLPFVWAHLEFPLDSVRHLANQILAACLDYCAHLEKRGESAPLESLLVSVCALGEARSFYWAACRAVPALGAARVLARLCDAHALLRAADTPHLQAAACAAISAVLSGGACAGLQTHEVFARWVRPALRSPPALRAVLPPALAAHPALLAYIGSHVHGRAALACVLAAPACGARVSQRALRAAALHRDDETRVLALSLLADSARSTAGVPRGELRSALWLLRHNMNAPRPGLRTELLAHAHKLLKRLDDSHRADSRRCAGAGDSAHYGAFVEQVRALCFAAALPGAGHARRGAALQLLALTDDILPTFTREWKAEYVETLLRHLDDSYDANKASALRVLQHCPLQLLEDCSRELTLESVLRGAVSLRAAGGAAAAAKLQLLLARLPHRIVPLPRDIHAVREENLRPHYALLRALLVQLRRVAESDAWQEAAGGGASGTLRCVADVLRAASAAEWGGRVWGALADELADECVRACVRAEPVVAHHAPEGYLPACPDTAIELEESRSVTAQMVLVCAWRTVKEAAAVLGLLAARGGGGGGVGGRAGGYLVALLMKAMHRGAVEQAAAGLAAVAHACWSQEERAHLPRQWARELLALAARGAPHATRRGAGLPAALQALVSSEVSATGRAECYNECVVELLRLASANGSADVPADGVARRTLAANILRALFRHAALEKVSHVHVAAGLRLALQGFEAAAWPERTAMSLLFCALCVRAFGVTRARGGELHARNTLPASLFFRRYTGIYDIMLSKLQEFEPGSAAGPGVLPVLLLLARLYPSAVEGAASSLKVCAFVPLVQRCACAAELRVRRAAARALPALLLPSQHFPYMERIFAAISQPNLLHNHWHGALLTLTSLLEKAAAPETASVPRSTPTETLETGTLAKGPQMTPGTYVSGSYVALAQATGPRPCYVVAREYVNVFNLLVWKFPEMVPGGESSAVMEHLDAILFSGAARGPDRELCLADCALLYFILLQKEKQAKRLLSLINRTLIHPCYEVIVSTLDYLLTQHHAASDPEPCNLRRHALAARDVTLTPRRGTSDYRNMIAKLSDCLHDDNMYQECRVKCLKLLTLEDNTQTLVVNEVCPFGNPNEWVARRLIHRIEDGHKDVKHMYLESLFKLSRDQWEPRLLLDVYRVMYDCCSAESSDDSRMAVVAYLEKGFEWSVEGLSELLPAEKFRYNALVAGTLVTLLEDDDDVIRQRASDVVVRVTRHLTLDQDDDNVSSEDEILEEYASASTLRRAVRDNAGEGVIASASGELLRWQVAREHGAPLLLLLALLDFRAEVCYTDEITEQCRVFDQSERYNMSLEESVWTAACADSIARSAEHKQDNLIEFALSIINDRTHVNTFEQLCNDNVKLFVKMAKGDFVANDTLNPKIEILVNKLRKQSQ